jgi:signal transduction histidine kinase
MTFALTVEGNSRAIRSIVRDDVYRIGCEAIRNACTHSGAGRLYVELSYVRDLILRVRDKGRESTRKFRPKGKDGHFGITGIQERAERVGSRLNLRAAQARERRSS